MPNCEALKAISRYSNEKPFILPVEAMLAVQDTSASSSRFVKVKRSGVSAKLLSSICCRASLGEGRPVLSDSICSLRETFLRFCCFGVMEAAVLVTVRP